jgi:hypothetical protein
MADWQTWEIKLCEYRLYFRFCRVFVSEIFHNYLVLQTDIDL